jgi:FkbM family methyltransferase
MGRRNLTRLARFLTNESRLDVKNDMESNGERLVQNIFIGIARLSKAPVVVFDVGANIGDWTCGLQTMADANSTSNIHLYSFEPCETTFRKLTENIEKLENSLPVHPVKLGFSNCPGISTLYVVGDESGTNSLYHHNDLLVTRNEKVLLSTVDIYCRENEIEKINYLKIDTEGHDQLVIEGATTMLEKGSIDFLQFEYSHRWITSRHFLHDTFETLMPFGYRIGKITPKGIEFYICWHYELESFREANFIACKTKYISKFPTISWWNAN